MMCENATTSGTKNAKRILMRSHGKAEYALMPGELASHSVLSARSGLNGNNNHPGASEHDATGFPGSPEPGGLPSRRASGYVAQRPFVKAFLKESIA